MCFYRIFFCLLTILFLHTESMAKAQTLNYSNQNLIAWSQICSCRSYYGIPHTCYYSPVVDPDYSCAAKCVREANQ